MQSNSRGVISPVMPIPVDSFYLDPDVEGTLQQKVQRLVAEGILSGRFRPGEKLPSSRKLARHLQISRITVTNAYTELLADDYLNSRGRSGYFVSKTAPVPASFGANAHSRPWGRRIFRS